MKPGNTSDKGIQMQFVDRLVKKYGRDGKLDSPWLMDRGVPTEETLETMRSLGAFPLAFRGSFKVS